MTSQPNVINDLSSYTKIPNKILQELVHKLNLCIGSAIHDAIINFAFSITWVLDCLRING